MTGALRNPLLWLAAAIALLLAGVVAMKAAHASSATAQLPDLVADPPDHISLEVSETSPTSEPTEPKLLLRFNGYVHNRGPGALDFRGSRQAPANPSEPAVPPMSVFQRVYNLNGSYTEEPSSGQMIYVEADGHDHWHLQRVAYYSLWNAQRTGEVAPAQKVGFCLEDSERVEATGPEQPVYSDSGTPPREFCRRYQPEATSVFEGISEGWRDVYTANLAFQWVDVSDVSPGEYWLRAEVDTQHMIQQTTDPKPPAYASAPTIVPGFDAQPQATTAVAGRPLAVTLTSQKWSGSQSFEQPSASPSYAIVSRPTHGTLSAVNGDQVTYTPAADYSGPDSFTFVAQDPASRFPLHPVVATVSVDVGNPQSGSSSQSEPSTTEGTSSPQLEGTRLPANVLIAGAPASMIAGTSVQLYADLTNDTPGVTWSATSGSITASGLYTAPSKPPSGGAATVIAQAAQGARDQRTIAILPVPPPRARPRAFASLQRPAAIRIARKLYLTAIVSRAGTLRLGAYLGGRRLGICVVRTRGPLSFTCVVTLPRGVSKHARISVRATLIQGHRAVHTTRPAAPVPSPK